MDTLTNLDRDIPKLVSEHIDLFDSFENVYLFGSILKPENMKKAEKRWLILFGKAIWAGKSCLEKALFMM